MTTTLNGLSMDFIILEILPRLPAKTLIRFKSVCKSLNSLISSRDFVRLYLRHQCLSSSAADKRLILASNTHINCYQLDPHATTTTTETTTFVYSQTSQFMSVIVIGTSNGLLCIRRNKGNSSEYSILNPTTRIYRCIRTPHEELGLGHSYGFGFDHENLDYIIVVSKYHTNPVTKGQIITSVYSLNKNSWTVVNEIAAATDSILPLRKVGALIDNYLLHWMFWNYALGKYRIGCFDICKKKWTDDVLLPGFYYHPTCNQEAYLVDIGVVDDCLFSTFQDKIENRFQVWVMKEYGVQESWVMLLSIPLSSCREVIKPVASCQSSNMVLVRQLYTSRLFWYNKVDGGLSDAIFDGSPELRDNIQAYMCSRSLVHLPGGELLEHSEAVRKSSTESIITIVEINVRANTKSKKRQY